MGLGLRKQMLPVTSILGSRQPISTAQLPCIFLHHVNPSWFRSATSSLTSRVCAYFFFKEICFHAFVRGGLPNSTYWILYCCWAYNLSKSHLGFTFQNLIIFFNLVQIFATNKLWSQSESAHSSYCFQTDVYVHNPTDLGFILLVLSSITVLLLWNVYWRNESQPFHFQ
jgi:hypothetical protein